MLFWLLIWNLYYMSYNRKQASKQQQTHILYILLADWEKTKTGCVSFSTGGRWRNSVTCYTPPVSDPDEHFFVARVNLKGGYCQYTDAGKKKMFWKKLSNTNNDILYYNCPAPFAALASA